MIISHLYEVKLMLLEASLFLFFPVLRWTGEWCYQMGGFVQSAA